ncbi:MAG: M17 family peptidase N-terminal domain-containing protein, partial [Pikeienuella sp.]
MTQPAEIDILSYEDAPMATAANAVVVFSIGDELSDGAKQADELSGGAITRVVGTKAYKATAGAVTKIAAPAGMAAEALYLVSLGETPNAAAAQKAGGALAAASGQSGMTIYGADTAAAQSEVMFALALRRYQFTEYKTENDTSGTGEIIFATNEAEDVARLSGPKAALAEGIYFTRDLVNEPANVLTTEDFAARLAAMGELGLEVEILGEEEMTELGMNALLEVGRASNDESKLVVMKWNGGGDEAPLAIVGKGVVFDTGGISLKPAGGMEEMTMDMGGAGV